MEAASVESRVRLLVLGSRNRLWYILSDVLEEGGGGGQRVCVPYRQLPFGLRRRRELGVSGHRAALARKERRETERGSGTAQYFISLDYFCDTFRAPRFLTVNVCLLGLTHKIKKNRSRRALSLSFFLSPFRCCRPLAAVSPSVLPLSARTHRPGPSRGLPNPAGHRGWHTAGHQQLSSRSACPALPPPSVFAGGLFSLPRRPPARHRLC